MKLEWCIKSPLDITDTNEYPKTRRYRCPHCKKRFMTYWWTCSGGPEACCKKEYLPPHKRSVKREN